MNRILALSLLALGSLSLLAQERNDSTAFNTTLDELVVETKAPVVTTNGGTTTYSVKEDPQSATLSVLEMLRKVPMVAVDGQDKITVNGQSSFKILIDGKEVPGLSANASTVFKNMPAAAVQKVEVITDPGAKYDAEGTGAVLNLVVMGGGASNAIADGYQINLSGNFKLKQEGAGVYARGKLKNVTASLNYDWAHSIRPQKTDWTLDEEFPNALVPAFSHTQGWQKNNYDYQDATLNLSWEPNQNNLFTIDCFGSFVKSKASLEYEQTVTYGDQTSATYTDQASKWKWGNFTLSSGYQHHFGRPDKSLNIAYQYNKILQRSSTTKILEDLNNPELGMTTISDSREPQNEHTAQIDYTDTFLEKHKLKTGFKGIFRRNPAKGKSGLYLPEIGDVWDPESFTDLKQFQDIYAAYATYTGTFGKWSLTAGLRFEHTRMGVDFYEGTIPNFSKSLNDWVPNGSLSYSFAQAHSLRASYQMKIVRPSVSQINPFVDTDNPMGVIYGNPDLECQKNHNFTLTYTNFLLPVGMNLSLNYKYADNMLSSYMYSENETVYKTTKNLGRMDGVSLNAYLMVKLWPKVQISLNGSVGYQHFAAKSPKLSNSGWIGNGNLNLTYSMPKNWELSVMGGGGASEISIQSSGPNYYYYMFGVNRSFMKDNRLKVALNFVNMFIKPTMKMRMWSDNSNSCIRIKPNMYEVGLTISYQIGSLKKNVTRRNVDIENDDITKSSQSKGGIN